MARRLALPLVLLVLLPSALRAESAEEREIKRAIALARDRVYPALVNLAVVSRQFVQGREQRVPSAGSGVIVSPSGHVLTNYHVAGEARRITAKLPNGEAIDADIVVGDPLTDLAVLKLRLGERKDALRPIPYAAIGDSGELQVGDRVLAMGNPLSLSSSITLGIVSNKARVFTNFTGNRIEQLEFGGGNLTGLFNRWIQHDALIQPGNSGGPLVNMNGQVIGINTRGGSGMGFAIPANIAKDVLNQALTYGEIRRGWVGVSIVPVTDLERADGALVSSVLPESPAAEAGLEPGDVILSIGGQPLAVTTFEAVPPVYKRMADLPAGRKATFRIDRDGERKEVEVAVGPMEPFIGDEKTFSIWGVSAMAITGPMAFARDYPDTKGVVITTLRPGGPPDSARPSIERGDVILEIDGETVETLEDFERLVKAHKRGDALAVRYRRGDEDRVTVLDMTKKPRRRGNPNLPKAWLGVAAQVMTPKIAKALDLEGTHGFRVTNVLPGTPAEKAGIQASDVLTAVDGDKLDAFRLEDQEILRRRIEDMDPGAEVEVDLIREGEPTKVTVTLGSTPKSAADARDAEDEQLEYKVRELVYMDKVERDLPLDYEGVVVSDVTLGGWAQVSGLEAGDIPLEIQGEAVKSLGDFKRVTKQLAEDTPERVTIFVRRGRSTAFVFIRPEWPED